jgi:hypothetical protein
MLNKLAKDIAPKEKIMHIAPLAVLSYSHRTTDSEDAVMISRVALEALLRFAFPGFSADDFDAASYLNPCSEAAPIVEDYAWQDELTHMLRFGFEDGSKSKKPDMDLQWFDDVAQAIDSGAISEAPLSFDRLF